MTNLCVKLESLIHLPWEAIDEETASSIGPTFPGAILVEGSLHSVLKEFDCDLHGHDVALLDTVLDKLAKLGAFTVLLCTKQIARGKMAKAKVLY